MVSLEALKHVADRWAFFLSADWQAQWIQHDDAFPVTPRYSDSLFYSARRWSTISALVAVRRQLSPRFALSVAPSVAQNADCVDVMCDWKWRSAGVAVMLGVRPLSWLTMRLVPAVGVRHRPDLPLPTTFPDGTPIMIPPLTVTWVSLAGWLDFYW